MGVGAVCARERPQAVKSLRSSAGGISPASGIGTGEICEPERPGDMRKEQTGRRRWTGRLVGTAGLVMVVAFVAIYLVMVRYPGASSADARAKSSHTPALSTASPPHGQSQSHAPTSGGASASPAKPAAPVKKAGSLDDATAKKVIDTYLDAAARTSPSSTDVSAQVSAVAGKRFISELEASLLELESQGWTLSGTPEIVLVRIISRDRNAR